MNCEQFRSLLEAAYDDKLGWLQRRRIWRHIGECDACREEYELAEHSIEAARERLDDGSFDMGAGPTPIAHIVNRILSRALSDGASRARLDPTDRVVMCRYEEAGEWRDALPLPRYIAAPIAARLKAMAQLDLRCTDAPQQGSFAVRYDGRARQVEIAFAPAQEGEVITLTFAG